jgi:hypothetical protein
MSGPSAKSLNAHADPTAIWPVTSRRPVAKIRARSSCPVIGFRGLAASPGLFRPRRGGDKASASHDRRRTTLRSYGSPLLFDRLPLAAARPRR